MQANTPVEWDELVTMYNHMYDADFKTPKAMIAHLYEEHRTLEGVSKIIGVSGWTIGRYMDMWRIPKLPRGHRGCTAFQLAFQSIKNSDQYTHKELAEILGCSNAYICWLKRYY